jgi:hypothetical protein
MGQVRFLYIILNFYKSNRNLDTIIRSVDLSKGFRTIVDSVNYVQAQSLPDSVPGLSNGVLWPTDPEGSNIDYMLGRYYPANVGVYGERPVPDSSKKWRYNTKTKEWTEDDIILQDFYNPTTTKVSSAMTVWAPELKKGFLVGGVFDRDNNTQVTEIGVHNGLITYDAQTDTWANQTTPIGGIAEGGLVHLKTATDDVLIQLGGWYGRTELVCSLVYNNYPLQVY